MILSPRQKEIATLVAEGKTSREIAERVVRGGGDEPG